MLRRRGVYSKITLYFDISLCIICDIYITNVFFTSSFSKILSCHFPSIFLWEVLKKWKISGLLHSSSAASLTIAFSSPWYLILSWKIVKKERTVVYCIHYIEHSWQDCSTDEADETSVGVDHRVYCTNHICLQLSLTLLWNTSWKMCLEYRTKS